MPKYLFRGSYTATGAAGVLKEGGTGRLAATRASFCSGRASITPHTAFASCTIWTTYGRTRCPMVIA